MLKLFDRNHTYIGPLSSYKKLCIESKLESKGDKTMSFELLDPSIDIENESIIETRDEEWVVKEAPKQMYGSRKIVCVLNLDDLKVKPFDVFALNNMTVDAMARNALAGTGWTVGTCDVTKVRNFGVVKMSPLQVMQNLATAFMCDVTFDTKRKKVNFYSELGSDRGVRFMEDLNLKKLVKGSTSYDFYTRIVPKGKNGLDIKEVNDGIEYLDNHQYSNKVITYLWDDDNYTDPNALKEDAEAKLEDLSKPEVSYSVDVIDLAKTGRDGSRAEIYADMLFSLGDTVTLVSRSAMIKEKQRVVSITEFPETPWENKCELSNTMLTFEEMQKRYSDAMALVEYSIDGLGSYKGNFGGEISVSQILHWETAVNNPGFISAVAGAMSGSGGSGGGGGDYAVYGKLIVNDLTADDVKITKSLKLQGAEVSGGTAAFDSIKTMYGDITYNVGEMLDYHKGRIDEFQAVYIDADFERVKDLEAIKANIWKLFVETELVKQVVMDTGHVTNYLDAVEVNADKVTAGTFLADRFFLWNEATQTYDKLVTNRVDEYGNPIVPVIDAGGVIAPQTIEGRHMVAHTVTSKELTTEDIKGPNGYFNFYRSEMNLGNQLIFENGELDIRLRSFGGTNLIRESGTLKFSDYNFVSGYIEITDENGYKLTDEYGVKLIM